MYPSPRQADRAGQARADHRIPRSKIGRAPRCGAVLILVVLLGGCVRQFNDNAMTNAYYINPYKNLNTIGRVAIVELDNTSGHPTVSTDVTKALFVALQKKQVFGLTIVGHDDPAWRGLQENLDSLQALKKLVAMRDTLKCDGLLVGTITEYQPYPRMALGLRLKLIDLTDGQLVWGLEQIWDTADHSIEKRIERYIKTELRSGVDSLREELVVISSLKFGKFVAHEVAETLDPAQN